MLVKRFVSLDVLVQELFVITYQCLSEECKQEEQQEVFCYCDLLVWICCKH